MQNTASNMLCYVLPWAFYQVGKIVGAHAPECPERFPRHRGWAIPTYMQGFAN